MDLIEVLFLLGARPKAWLQVQHRMQEIMFVKLDLEHNSQHPAASIRKFMALRDFRRWQCAHLCTANSLDET